MRSNKKKIIVTTGTRAEYGVLKPLLEQIKKNPKFQLYLIVAGMHLSKKFGYSVNEIIHDGFTISGRVKMVPLGNSGYEMSVALSEGIKQFSNIFRKVKPDINVILGDRDEAFAAALAAMHMNIVNVHIAGGDISKGGIDEYIRHAITKISNVHFVSTQKSHANVIKMGEDKKYVFQTGSPTIDGIPKKFPSKNDVLKKYGLRDGYLLIIQHPVTTEVSESGDQMKTTLEAVVKTGRDAIVIGPNSDAGHQEILQTIKRYVKKYGFIKFHVNLPRDEYLSLLKYCDLIMGNSSSGIIDAPIFKKAAINIGIRQEGRESAGYIVNTTHNTNSILRAVKYVSSPQFKHKLKKSKNVYGDGNASYRIVRILENLKITPELLQKKITYK